ncbi:MAG: type VI secretion system baseplate subunit TssK [Desulfovibrio sp.]|nr:type VI secretion system baseplate subunit TssK [Desulfovibrio sp.]
MHTTPLLFWEHGTLLQPQHFQLSDRRMLEETGLLRSFLCPHAWGVRELEIDEDALAAGIFQVKRLDMLLPQGEHLVMGENAVLPSRGFAELWTDPQTQLECRIGLPLPEEGSANVTEVPGYQPGDLAGTATRWVASDMPDAVSDAYAGGPEADVRFMRYNACILFSTEKELLGKTPSWPLARLVREGDKVRLAPSFAPPCLDIAASPVLQGALGDVRNAVCARAGQLEDFKLLPGSAGAGPAGMSAVTAQTLLMYSMLGVLSRWAPLLEHLCETGHLHPWPVYGMLRQLAGELSLFSPDLSVLCTTRQGVCAIPPYSHEDPGACFSSARIVISRLIDLLATGPAHSFSMQRREGVFACELPAYARSGFDFWLQIRDGGEDAEVQEAARQAKFAPAAFLRALVGKSLPGIPLIPSDVPPPGLPKRADTSYFAVDSRDPLWAPLLENGACALFLPGMPEECSVNLVLINSGRAADKA